MREDNGSTATGILLGIVIGAAAGAALALLLAPASGEETRRRLSDTARKLGYEGKRRVDDLREMAGDRVSEVKEAVKAGRDAYREARSTQREPSMGS